MTIAIAVLSAIGGLLVLGAAGGNDCGTMPFIQCAIQSVAGASMILLAKILHYIKNSRPDCWSNQDGKR